MEEALAANPDSVRVLVADDRPVVREGLSLLLEAVDGFEAVDCASTCDELLSAVCDWEPDVVLLDFRVGGNEGLVVSQRIKLLHPGVGVLLFPTEIAAEQVERALGCGVDGVILKTAPVPEVLDAITAVGRGGAVVGRDLIASSDSSHLSIREREVLQLMAAGLNNREISQSLFISLATTKTHLERIARKLGTSHRAAAVAEAIRRGLVA